MCAGTEGRGIGINIFQQREHRVGGVVVLVQEQRIALLVEPAAYPVSDGQQHLLVAAQ